MLDTLELTRQLQGIGSYMQEEAEAGRRRLTRGRSILAEAQQRQTDLVAQQQQWRDRLAFAAAEPIEPLSTRVDLAPAPADHSIIATDGSQIAPSHHEIAYCYLINVGRAVLHYGRHEGRTRHPRLDSRPEIFYKPEDLYLSRQWGIGTEEWMGYRRTVSESEALAELGQELLGGDPAPVLPPILAMVDGSLIYWFLEQLPAAARDRLLPPILAAWDELRDLKLPLLGYLSASRSVEATNFLRLATCSFSEPDCKTHCPEKGDATPCHVLRPLRDASLWGALLEPGQRGPLWRSSARILENYGAHGIYFCHVNVGSEVARVEVPEWVVGDRALFDRALSLMLAQVQKGFGYPVALAEAHNQAVVRGGDRSRFFVMLEQEMIQAGLRNIGTSYKEARKRGSIA